jgi:hypothetical protein
VCGSRKISWRGQRTNQVEGETAQRGSAFYEPMGRVIADFRNASDLEPLIFAAFYLKDGVQDLITMLDEG